MSKQMIDNIWGPYKQKPNNIKNRKDRLMPNGVPRYIRIYDDSTEGGFIWVFYTGNHKGTRKKFTRINISSSDSAYWNYVPLVGLSDRRFGKWPVGVGKLDLVWGRRIAWDTLSDYCKIVIRQQYMNIWELN